MRGGRVAREAGYRTTRPREAQADARLVLHQERARVVVAGLRVGGADEVRACGELARKVYADRIRIRVEVTLYETAVRGDDVYLPAVA